MFFAGGAGYLAVAYLDRPSQFFSDFQQGLSVSAIFVGLWVATPIEFAFWLATKVYFETNRK